VDAERGRGMADDADDPESVDGRTGTGGRRPAGVSGDPAGRRARRYGGPAPLSVAYTGMDGAGFSDAWHHDADQLRTPVGVAVVDVSAGSGCGDERSGVAGDYPGVGSLRATRFGSGAEFGGLQRSASGGTGVGRYHCGRGRLRHNILAERIFVPGRDLVSLPLEAADCGSTEDSARGVGNRRRVQLRTRERT